MGKYGFFQYGTTVKYGAVDANRIYYSSGISAWSYDYKSISLTWSTIIPDPSDSPYIPTHWRLVRSFVGLPDSPYSGTVLDSDLISNYRLTYIDTDDALLDNAEATYTIWVYNGLEWINTGGVTVNTVAETSTQTTFKRWLPAAWLNERYGIGDAIGEPELSDLTTTIDAYAFEYDKLKVYASLIEDSVDPSRTPAILLENKVTELGFLYEPSLGDIYHRSLYKAGHTINSLKGTALGITAYTTALTHWPSSILIGQNLMLDYNDSSFEESTGRWSVSGGTLARQVYATAAVDLGVPVVYATPKLYDLAYPPRAIACGLVTSTSGAVVTLDLPNTDVITKGIPVEEGVRYIVKGWIRHIATAGTVVATISWYDRTGTLISTTSAGTALTTTTSWQEFRSASDAIQNGKLAPFGARYAKITIVIDPASAENKYLIDLLEFKVSTSNDIAPAGLLPALEYQDARLVNLNLEADLENIIPNPGFEQGTGWWRPLNADLTQDFNPPANSKIFGSSVAKLTVATTGTAAIVSDWLLIAPGTPHNFSAYVSGTVGRTAIARIEYSSPASDYEQTTVSTDAVDGSFYYDPTSYYIDSEEFVITANAQRLDVSLVSPAFTPDYGSPLVKVSVYFPNAVAGDVFYIDSTMLSPFPEVKDYFQGNGAPAPVNPNTARVYYPADCRWEKRHQLNFVSNPQFADTTDWTAGSGTTLTASTDFALFGTKSGKVSKTGGGSISTVITLPSGASLGGKDIVISAYVKNKAGTYSIGTNDQLTNTFIVSEANKDEWTRLDVTRIDTVGETTFTLTISLDTGSATAAVFYVDGVQAEYGRYPTPYIDTTNINTTTDVNPADVTKNIYYAYSDLAHSSSSYYSHRYDAKLTRLSVTLPSILPVGTSWQLGTPPKEAGFRETTLNSLLESPSFEKGLDGWVPIASTLKKAISGGTLTNDKVVHGVGYCKITSTAASDFGIATELIDVSAGTGYYVAAAVRPVDASAYGTYKLKLNWYDEADAFLYSKETSVNLQRHDRVAHLQIVAPGSKTLSVVSISVTSGVATATAAAPHGLSPNEVITLGAIAGTTGTFPYNLGEGSYTIDSVTDTTFSFAFTEANQVDTAVETTAIFLATGLAKAKVEILVDPDTPASGLVFEVDRVLFRE
jgi:hypothetical protein